MQGKIALEEHFAIPETLLNSKGFLPESFWPEMHKRLLDFHEMRIAEMDRHGVEMMLLSLNAPAVQAIADPKRADEVARKSNDVLAEAVRKQPDRFQAFAALPLQDPDLAIEELRRCVKELGFKGALVNGFSQGTDPDTALYYDLPQYWPFWEEVERLDVPFYLHPRNPLPGDAKIYEGHGWLMGPVWAFAQETAVHALRLMGCGLFDKYPRLTIVLGHLGEGLPFNIWRIDHRNGWAKMRHNCPAKRPMVEYFRNNFYLTTSGDFSTPTLLNAMSEIGADRVMFSIDWPFEDVSDAAEWFDAAPISEQDRIKIGRDNARRLFKLA
jgi:2,3-dihydroxybenzoate decarboxylase